MLRNSSPSEIIILDASIWIKGLFGIHDNAKQIINDCLAGKLNIIVNSYIVAEITRAIKRIALKSGLNPLELERSFWAIINSDNVLKDFNKPISEDLVEFLKNSNEILLIAKAFNLEPKDVPYIVLAFKFKALIITEDIRSLYVNKDEIKRKLGIIICSLSEFKANYKT